MSASRRWRAMVEAEHAQSDRMRPSPPPDDHWAPHAHQFRVDPRRTDDPLLSRLLQDVKPHHTVIDVGAGGGRLAMPLALRCRRVTAVEPSPSMCSVLLQQVEEYETQNVSVVESRWEDADITPADIVLCVHVLYVVRDIEGFIRKLEAHGRERVLIVLFKDPPQSQTYPIWKLVHGEERLPLPSLPQLEEVLEELGINARMEALPPQGNRGFDSPGQALEQLSSRLYLHPGSPKRGLLESMLPDLLEEEDGAFRIRRSRPLEPMLVWWGAGI